MMASDIEEDAAQAAAAEANGTKEQAKDDHAAQTAVPVEHAA